MAINMNYYTSIATTWNTCNMPRIRYVDFRLYKNDAHEKVIFVRNDQGLWSYFHFGKGSTYILQSYGHTVSEEYIKNKLNSSVIVQMITDEQQTWLWWSKDLIKDMLEYLVKNT